MCSPPSPTRTAHTHRPPRHARHTHRPHLPHLPSPLALIVVACTQAEHSTFQHLDVIFDYKKWLGGDGGVFTTSGVTLCRADEEAQVVGMKTARYFLIRKREDGTVAFWYKPSPAHAHLYPSKKGADGSPMYTMVDGEKQYITCPDGIEIFHLKDGPSAVSPPLAEFPRKKDDDQPYFQVTPSLMTSPAWSRLRSSLTSTHARADRCVPQSYGEHRKQNSGCCWPRLPRQMGSLSGRLPKDFE